MSKVVKHPACARLRARLDLHFVNVLEYRVFDELCLAPVWIFVAMHQKERSRPVIAEGNPIHLYEGFQAVPVEDVMRVH